MKLIKVTGTQNIEELILSFEDVFPHLKEKIESIEEYSKKLGQYANVYKGVIEEKVFGILIFYANDTLSNTAYISLIGIKKEFEHNGLGSWLLQECEHISTEHGMEQLKLEVDADNEHALNFYMRNGMEICADKNKNSIYMCKSIIA